MSETILNTDDLAARPKEIEASTAESIMGGLVNKVQPTAPVTTTSSPSGGPSSSGTTTTGEYAAGHKTG